MQVLIPISSRSQFFPEAEYYFPKPLVDVDGLPMIERVISNIREFVDNPKFIFVVDREDCVKFSLEKLLIILGGRSTVVVPKDFETAGALCSVLLAVDHIDLDEPLIISNCDTVLGGDIKGAMPQLLDKRNDASVFTFNSIHPRWSYVSGGEKNSIEQVYEKEVVSNKALAGLYYFKNAGQFVNAAKDVVLNGGLLNDDYYISSTINQIILCGGLASFVQLKERQVHIFFAPQAIERFKNHSKDIWSAEEKKMNIVIPAAGMGSRFSNEGWKKPKPFIDVGGKAMVARVMSNLKTDHSRLTVLLQEGQIQNYSEDVGNLTNQGATIFEVPQLTEGTACTVLAAEPIINTAEMLLVANSDQIVDFDVGDYVRDCKARNLDGSILVFRDEYRDPKWSFAKVSDCGLVTEVAEKKPISDLATVGIYLFKTGSSFVSAALQMIVANDRVNNEFYTCPVYNYMIKNGLQVGVYEVSPESMHGMGTPEDLNEFLQKKKYPASKDAP